MALARVATALAFALCACAIDASYDDTRFDCSGGATCPDGFACVADVCMPDGAGDGAQPGDASPAAECGRASDLTDDFDDGATAAAWQATQTGGASYAESDGSALFELASQQAGAAAYQTVCRYDLSDDEVVIAVLPVGRKSGATETFFGLFGDGGDLATMYESDGTLHMTVITQGATTTTAVGFDAGTDLFWRIAGDGDEVGFYVSPDGQAWEKRGETAAPAELPQMRVSFGVRAEASSSGVRAARFDDYNGG